VVRVQARRVGERSERRDRNGPPGVPNRRRECDSDSGN